MFSWIPRIYLRPLLLAVAVVVLALLTSACGVALESETGYQSIAPSSDGIGKVYMGREIAQVMGHEGAYWLERPSRSLQEKPDLAIAALDLPADAVIADIGAGTGYMSLRLAAQAPEGKVLAVDIQPEMIELIEAAKQEHHIDNLETVQGQPDSLNLLPETVDIALMVDAYHEFEYPCEILQALMSALKPGGQVVLAEYRAENPLILIKKHHKMSEVQVKRELTAAGFEWRKTEEFLPQQHLLFFQKPIS